MSDYALAARPARSILSITFKFELTPGVSDEDRRTLGEPSEPIWRRALSLLKRHLVLPLVGTAIDRHGRAELVPAAPLGELREAR